MPLRWARAIGWMSPVGIRWTSSFSRARKSATWPMATARRWTAQDHKKPLWEFKQSYSGAGYDRPAPCADHRAQGRPENGLTLTTTKRTYYLDLNRCTKTAARSVRWTYPDEPPKVAKVPPRLWPDPAQPQRYHAGYEITASEPTPVWTVRQVVDDGHENVYLISRQR